MHEIPGDVGRVLERLRIEAGRKQSEIAEALGLHPSRISRLETGAVPPVSEDVGRYLDAVGTVRAAIYRDILAEDWTEIGRPDPWHPNARELIETAALLRKLDEELLADAMLPQSLSSQAQFLRGRLLTSTS